MAPITTQNFTASNDEAWQDFLDLIAWPSEGGKIPQDEEPPEPPFALSVSEDAGSKEPTNLNTR